MSDSRRVWFLWARELGANGEWRPWDLVGIDRERESLVYNRRGFKPGKWQLRVECISLPVPPASAEPTMVWCPTCGVELPGNSVKCEHCEED